VTLVARRRLGRTLLDVSPLCLGANVFGWTIDRERSFEVLDAYVGAGGNFVDTADHYSAWVPGLQGGESEAVLGEWLLARGARDRVVLASKVGKGGGGQPPGLSAQLINAGVERSLRRLNTDYLDLYYAHEDDVATPLDETLEAFANLVQQGKVRAIGASNYRPERLQEAIEISVHAGWPAFDVVQPLYNLVDRGQYEGALQAVCLNRELAVVSYFSLARGFLTGKYRAGGPTPASARAGQAVKYLSGRGPAVLAELDNVGAAHGATPGQVALAWLAARPGIVCPIASATNTAQLAELMAFSSVELTDDEITRLASAGEPM
jgi:aryl-alcohol dehydrogenase-like predicted oxidoreductase